MCCILSILEKLTANFCLDKAQVYQSYWLYSRGSHYSSGMQRLEALCKCCKEHSQQQAADICTLYFSSAQVQWLAEPVSTQIHTSGITAGPGHSIMRKIEESIFNKHIQHAAPPNHLYQKRYKQHLQSPQRVLYL